MKTDKYFIKDEHKKLIKLFIGSTELDKIAEQTNTGISTVFNIIAQRVAINHKNMVVVQALNVALYEQLAFAVPMLKKTLEEMEQLIEVQDYLKKRVLKNGS